MLHILQNSTAGANNCSAMEADTISKNGRSSKSQTSRGMSYFSLFIFILPMLIFSSCMSQYWKYETVKVHGTPNADIFFVYYNPGDSELQNFLECDFNSTWYLWKLGHKENYKVYAGTTNDLGDASFTVSKGVLKKIKGMFIAEKSGYQPTSLKIKWKSKSASLLNMDIPSDMDCFQYFDLAQNANNNKDKIKYLELAISQDYRNENGIKVQALNDLGIVYSNMKYYNFAFLSFNEAKKIDPENDIVNTNLEYLRQTATLAIDAAKEKERLRDEKLERIVGTLQAIGGALQDVSNAIPASNSSSSSSTGASSSNSSSGYKSLQSGTSNNSQKADCGQAWITDSNTYSNYETLIIKGDPDSDNIRAKMRQIRQKWEARGCKITKSPYE